MGEQAGNHQGCGLRRAACAVALALAAALGLGACADKSGEPRDLTGADPARGLQLIEATGCAACHVIPGVRWPRGQVGGSLEGFGGRTLIAGRTPNQPDALVAFLRDPAATQSGGATPPTALSEAQLRDIAAYLYTLDD